MFHLFVRGADSPVKSTLQKSLEETSKVDKLRETFQEEVTYNK